MRDANALEQVFDAHPIEAAILFAALKAVGESVAKPIDYYRKNLDGLLVLLEVMRTRNVKRFVFNSSATVYGVPGRSSYLINGLHDATPDDLILVSDLDEIPRAHSV